MLRKVQLADNANMFDALEGSTTRACAACMLEATEGSTFFALHIQCYGRFNLLAPHTCLVFTESSNACTCGQIPLAMHSNKAWLSVTLKETVETHWKTADLPGAKPNKHLGSSQSVALTKFKRVKIGSWRRKTGTTSWWNSSTYTSHIPGLQWSTGFRLCLMSWPLWEPPVNPACCYRLPEREVQFVALRVDSMFIFIGSGGGNRWKLYIISHLQQVHQNTSVKH